MNKIYKYVLFFIFTISLSASSIEDGKQFKELIIGYNHGVIKASQKSKFKHLEKYLTKEIRLKTRVWIESFHDNFLFMDALFLKANFSDFQMNQYSASMQTNELWKYRYINTKSKKIVIKPTKVEYKLKYFFVLLKDGSWKINHIKILEEVSTPIKEKK